MTYRVFATQTKSLLTCAFLAAALTIGLVGSPAFARTFDDDTVGDVTAAELPKSDVPDTEMAAGVLCASDGRLLWTRSPREKRAMASTTKIMTAIVVLENAKLDDVVKVSKEAASTSESAAEIQAGKRYTVETLLEALLVKSGNDAAVALAEHVGGSKTEFAAKMNDKAKELGLENTFYANPHGLDESSHYTCAEDLATVARYAMKLETFRRIVGLESVKIRPENGGSARTLENSNDLIGSFEGATGIKTGWTNDAGYCLVASAKRGEIELFAVVLGTETESVRFREAKKLLEWGFSNYRQEELTVTGARVAEVRVSDYLDVAVAAAVAETVTVPVFGLDGGIESRLTLVDSVRAPVSKGDQLGTLNFIQGGRLVAQVPVVAAEEVEAPGMLEKAWIWVVRGWRRMTGDIGLGGIPEVAIQ